MNEPANFRAASAEEFKTIYEWMEKQFHAGELKYLSTMEALRAQDRYEVYGLWANETLIAYALLAFTEDGRFALLDYYAVLPEYQSSGWGGRFLSMLREELDCEAIILEVEDPKYAPDAAEEAHFSRRIRFYERNRCLHSPVKLNLRGYDYTIMTLPITREPKPAEIYAALEDAYNLFFPPEDYAQNVRFREDEIVG